MNIGQIENVCHKIEITTAGVRTPSATFGVAASVGDLQTERQTGSQQRTFIGVLTFLYFFLSDQPGNNLSHNPAVGDCVSVKTFIISIIKPVI